MAKASYSQIGGPDGHLAKLEPFEGNSMSATREANGRYVVWSYATAIGSFAHGEFLDYGGYYSKTTSRHQSLMRAWTGAKWHGPRTAS